jgi:hypothetical protein
VNRRRFLSHAFEGILFLPAAGALSSLLGCGDSGTQSPTPTSTPAPTPAAPQTAAPAPATRAPGAAPAVPADALVTDVPANATLVSSLQYASVTPVAGQQCDGCQLYTAVGPEKGKCALFPQGLVAARGHCTSWIKKQI